MDIDIVPEGPKFIPPYNSRNQSSLGDLLLGFLKYYATEFRYPQELDDTDSRVVDGTLVLFHAHFLGPVPHHPLFLPTFSPTAVHLSSPSSVLHPPLWFHVSG